MVNTTEATHDHSHTALLGRYSFQPCARSDMILFPLWLVPPPPDGASLLTIHETITHIVSVTTPGAKNRRSMPLDAPCGTERQWSDNPAPVAPTLPLRYRAATRADTLGGSAGRGRLSGPLSTFSGTACRPGDAPVTRKEMP